jgi:predicted hydrocarbon binding protein
VEEVKKTEVGYQARISESACSSGLHTTEPNCAFTMGVFAGALEVIVKRRLNPTEKECVAVGSTYCIYDLEIL